MQARFHISTRCECPSEANASSSPLASWYSEEEQAGMDHTPGECRGTYKLAPYLRGEQVLWLCSCCYLWDDELIAEGVEDGAASR